MSLIFWYFLNVFLAALMCKWSLIFYFKTFAMICGHISVWWGMTSPTEKNGIDRINCICLLTVQCMTSCWHVSLSSGSSAAFYTQEISRTHASEFAHFSFTLSLCCKHSKTQHLYFYQYINQCYLSTWICSHTSKMLAVLPCWAALYIAVNTLGVHTDWKSCANRDTRLVCLMVLFIRDRLMNWCSFSKVQNVHHQHDVALTAD